MTYRSSIGIKQIIVATILAIALSILAFSAASAAVEAIKIYAKALNTQTCGPEWHFVITGINPVPAPSSITVKWGNGTTTQISLSKQVGNVAHYSDYTHTANDTVVEASAVIDPAWSGQFNLSHRPCADPTKPPLTPTPKVTSTPRVSPTPSNTPQATQTPHVLPKTGGMEGGEDWSLAIAFLGVLGMLAIVWGFSLARR